LRLTDGRWEHLMAAPEGLIAVAAAGRYVYALGYFDHVLYRYDCRTGASNSVKVGSIGGHISRNFFCDIRGHAYVPRLQRRPGSGHVTISLVEFDPDLQEVGDTPIAFYTQTPDDSSHGIVGVQPLADESIVFVADQGYLYRVMPQVDEPADVQILGWLDPGGRAYTASLFTSDGRQHVLGLTTRNSSSQRPAWLVYDLAARRSVAVPVPLPSFNGRPRRSVAVPVPLPSFNGRPVQDLQVYGSITRDNVGRWYAGGSFQQEGQWRPMLLQIQASA
jgi:hypothetical protein